MTVSASALTRYSLVVSAVFSLALGGAAFVYHSDLALAQSADSLVDIMAAWVLAWSVRVGAAPSDEGHPMGHSRAEPLGALAIAFVSAALAFEVASRAIGSLLGDGRVDPVWGLLGLFVLKVLAKALLLLLANGSSRSPAVQALVVDARNDVLVGVTAIFGFWGARAGYPTIDPLLALPVAVWIAWSGFHLAKDNIDLLMGAAAPLRRQQELLEIAIEAPGIVEVHDLRAQHLGTTISLSLHVSVRGDLSVREGHDLGEVVRLRLLQESDVGDCSVHVDPAESGP